jgi:hypothetical protein
MTKRPTNANTDSSNERCVVCKEPLAGSPMRTDAGPAHPACVLAARRKEREAEEKAKQASKGGH